MGDPIPLPDKKPGASPEAATLGYEIEAGPYFWPYALSEKAMSACTAYLAKKHGIPLEKK